MKSVTKAVKYWYLPLIFGIVFILFGIYIFTTPLETYIALSILFSVSFFFSGVSDVVFAIANAKSLNGWGWYFVNGLLTTVMGIYLMAYSDLSMLTLAFVIGFTALFRSFQLLGLSLELKDIKNKDWKSLAAISVLSIIFSFLLVANPLFSGLSIVTLTAIAFLFIGVGSISLAFILKRLKDSPDKLTSDLKARIEELQKEVNKQLQ